MSHGWTPTSEALPQEGGNVEFLLESRQVPMSGRYQGGLFVSRWSEYAVDAVHQWRAVLAPLSHLQGTQDSRRANGRA